MITSKSFKKVESMRINLYLTPQGKTQFQYDVFFFVQKLLCIIRFFLPLSFFKPKLIFVVEFQEKMEILNHPALKITKLNETFLKSCSSHEVKQSLSACKILISTRIKKCRMMFYVYYKTPLSVTDPEWKPYPLTLSTR